MSRLAEFVWLEDAQDFQRMKGKDAFEICAGINMNWAVLPKRMEAINHSPFEPADVVPVRERDPDLDMEDYE